MMVLLKNSLQFVIPESLYREEGFCIKLERPNPRENRSGMIYLSAAAKGRIMKGR
jgi:hypothetical protein